MLLKTSVTIILLVLLVDNSSISNMSAFMVDAEDTFNYHETNVTKRSFAPKDWNNVTCQEVETCPGWPTNWEQFNDFLPYDKMKNQCIDCSTIPTDKVRLRKCRKGLQSPIDLQRNITARQPCQDRHRMNYIKGDCRFDDMDFQVLPHVLRVYQPHKCDVAANIDFSFGYPQPWLLEFTDISVPSHHTQDGYRYDAEVMLSHTYSSDGQDRYLGNVAVFLSKGKGEDHYDFLELYLREWIKNAVNTRQACKVQLESEDEVVWNEYFDNDDDEGTMMQEKWDLWLEDSEEVDGPDESTLHSEAGRDLMRRRRPTAAPTVAPEFIDKKWYQGPWHPYDWVDKSMTEYYFRYLGSLVEPPCFVGVHWRVMRRPIKISPRQLELLEMLLVFRLNPDTCKRDTVGKPRPVGKNGKKVDVNRPIQQLYNAHELVYCECVDWNSSKVEDEIYCNRTMEERGVSEWTNRPSSSPT